MLTLQKNVGYDIFTSSFQNVEIADDLKRAIITIPLMHVGPNAKGLYWTEKMLKEVAPLFRGVTFRYDLHGQEGSSHTINKLSSPHFDVGWTYSNQEGAWYDSEEKTLWVKGEVTHPDVVEKLNRTTTDGKREVNFASMGILVEVAKCSICGSEYGECNHERLQEYEGQTCYKVPTECSKGLHVALTNDPADGEAEIEDCIFQELRIDSKHPKAGDYQMSPNGIQQPMKKKGESNSSSKENESPKNTPYESPAKLSNAKDNETISPVNKQTQTEVTNQLPQYKYSQTNKPDYNQLPGGLAPSSPQTAQPGMTLSPEEILTQLAERIKTIENKINSQSQMQSMNANPMSAQPGMEQAGQTPELVNAKPQDQFTQDNMGTTKQFEEEKNMEVKDAQNLPKKTPVNPQKPEVQDGMAPADPMQQIMGMLQQILQKLNGHETQDMGKEALDVTKASAGDEDSEVNTAKKGHLSPGDMVSDDTHESNKKNKQHMQEPGKVATADNSDKMQKEFADLQAEVKELRKKLEIQDSEIPEFGGTNMKKSSVEAADMSAKERADKFGDYGKWDACFKGTDSASKFMR